MKQQLLFTGMVALGISAFAADVTEPKAFNEAFISAVSSNGVYAVSQTYEGVRIFNLLTGQEDSYFEEGYEIGLGKCVSDNGIVVGDLYGAPLYWEEGEWLDLPLPDEATSTNMACAITPDASRICGSIGVAKMSEAYEKDVLMQAPCIWNANEDGYDEPVMLPHPEFDLVGRVPQYIKALDISADGKIIVGEITDATGLLCPYPIIYKEGEDGKWSYELPHENLLMPEGLVMPKDPSVGPTMPAKESYMTPEEKENYISALNDYYEAGDYNAPAPKEEDFMTEAEIAEYNAAYSEYEVKYKEWEATWDTWADAMQKCRDFAPGYANNSFRISYDGKTYACSTSKEGEKDDPLSWFTPTINNVWVFDVNSDAITKYNQRDDLNLNYLADNGVVLAFMQDLLTESFVLSNGNCESISDWMNGRCPAYASWIDENMKVKYEIEDFETGEIVVTEGMMTGRAVATPDLGKVFLSIENYFDYEIESPYYSYLFDIESATGVDVVRPADSENTIFDLSGRKLKDASAPGIYIVNGEKKVIR